jgi:ABC-type transport system involved in cytochrome c biogenesis permease component
MLVAKELRLEVRGKELITLLMCTSIITAVLVGAGVSGAVLHADTTAKIFPMLLWIVFLLSTTSASVRGNEHEMEGRGYEGLLLCGVSGAQMYLAKVAVWTVIFALNWFLLCGLLAMVLDQDVTQASRALAVIGLLASITLACLSVLTSAISSSASLRGVILPLITLPLVFPVFFAGIESTIIALDVGIFDFGSIWTGILVVSFTLFVLVGINTYHLVISE